MSKILQALINPNALKHNINKIKSIAPNSNIIAMIKANAYGHGLLEIAQLLDSLLSPLLNSFFLGVACLPEALQLRQNNIKIPIILMQGFTRKTELDKISNLNLQPVIHNDFQLNLLYEYLSTVNTNINTTNTINIWLKIDTGMHRLGFSAEEFPKIYNNFNNKFNNFNIKITGIMSHFSHADEVSNPKTAEQIKQFLDITQNIPNKYHKSLANSAAILHWPNAHLDYIRPGLMLYGISPIAKKKSADYDLLPVMTLQTEIIEIKYIKKNQSIGYSGSFTCPEDMPIAIIAIGYADGYPRNAPNGTPVLVNNKRTSLIGKISMDMASIDLRNIPDAKIGDKVILWGKNLPIEEVAEHVGTIPYELLTNLGIRVNRIVKM